MKYWVLLCATMVLISNASSDTKIKDNPLSLSGLHAMRYFPPMPYGMLGYKPPLWYGPGYAPKPIFVKPKTLEEEAPVPLAPTYYDLDKTLGYGGLLMPYGGYGFPMLHGF